jgi:hypothetical protein
MLGCLGPLGARLEEIATGGVPEPLCKPTKLYRNNQVDLRKLRVLIKQGKLVPCFPGSEASVPDRENLSHHVVVSRLLKRKRQDIKNLSQQLAEWEECPICCLHYPVSWSRPEN